MPTDSIPSHDEAAISAFLAAAGDHLALLEEHISGRVGHEWPAEAAKLRDFTPAQGRAVLAWLGSRLMAGVLATKR